MKSYSSNDVCRLTGITPRQLQWADERKCLSPAARKGHSRSFEDWQVLTFAACERLKQRGVSNQQVRPVYKTLITSKDTVLRQVLDGGAEYYLVVLVLPRKFRALMVDGGNKLLRLVARAPCSVMVVSLRDVAMGIVPLKTATPAFAGAPVYVYKAVPSL